MKGTRCETSRRIPGKGQTLDQKELWREEGMQWVQALLPLRLKGERRVRHRLQEGVGLTPVGAWISLGDPRE